MKTFELIAPCHFGMEAVLKREISDLEAKKSALETVKSRVSGEMVKQDAKEAAAYVLGKLKEKHYI